MRDWLLRLAEGCLLAAAFIPLVWVPSGLAAYFGLPKVVLLRLIAALAVASLALAWAAGARGLDFPGGSRLASLRRGSPGLAMLAAGAFLLSHVLSTLTSLDPLHSLWGSYPEVESGLLVYLSYFALFGVAALVIRGPRQLWRLLAAIAVAGTLVALLAALQHFRVVPLPRAYTLGAIPSSLGNPLYLGGYLALTSMASLGLLLRALQSGSRWPTLGWGLGMLLQVVALVASLSRGPSIAATAGGLGVLLLGWLLAGRRAAALAAAGLALSIGLALTLPSPHALAPLAQAPASPTQPAVERPDPAQIQDLVGARVAQTFSTTEGRGSIYQRLLIWQGALHLIAERPWPEEVSDPLRPLRHLVGYGLDLSRGALPLVYTDALWEATSGTSYDRVHNRPLEVGIEQGALGLASYAAWLLTLAVLAWTSLHRARDHEPSLVPALIAVSGVMAAHFLNQLSSPTTVSGQSVLFLATGALVGIGTGLRSRDDQSEQPVSARHTRAVPPAPAWSASRLARALPAALLVPLAFWAGLNALQADAAHQRGIDLLRANRVQEALRGLEESAVIAPYYADYAGRYGVLLYSAFQGSPNEVRRTLLERSHLILQQALDYDRASYQRYRSLGVVASSLVGLGDQSKREEARHLLRTMQALVPRVSALALDRAQSLAAMGEYAEAEQVVQEVLARPAPPARAAQLLAQVQQARQVSSNPGKR